MSSVCNVPATMDEAISAWSEGRSVGIIRSGISLCTSAQASCRISNETGISFKVESGNTSNQSVGAHTSTSIAAGRIIGRGDGGKTVSGSCKDGDELKIIDDHGVPVIVAK